jgi:hypothetical protein
MNDFDNLAKLALNEGTLSDYMNAVKRASNAAANKPIGKKIVKGVLKGAAAAPGKAVQGLGKLGQFAGKAIQGAGAVYGALGGTQGVAIANRVGNAVSNVGGTVANAGKTIAAAPQVISNAIRQYGQSYEFKQKYLKPYRDYIKTQFLKLSLNQKRDIDDADDMNKINFILKKAVPGLTDKRIENLATAFYKQKENDPEVKGVLAGQTPEEQKTAKQQPDIQAKTNVTKKRDSKGRFIGNKPKTPVQSKIPVKTPKKFNTQASKTNLKYNTNAPTPHTGKVAGSYKGKMYPPPSGIKL